MKIEITKEQHWFSADIANLSLSTQGETFDELINNVYEAIELYYEDEKSYQIQKMRI